ncbi:eukaryotic translation initiation factor eIF2A-domain-containing protein [Lentinula edodes]|uniref:eukaryotic translation initiation factor eIF2A-domain-containing protein n=1 Tax=Lentinula edodes TaxID=5353 RepID=UPI001E8C9E8B|nr:eukaryotic translation initiation factor eIF2A-domain-containing protein [Lentinula edodes]KAH7874554.1 eukaryotic translation initiation factor eIF2A-domain-containing protein [Lentinula edodes]
MTSQITQQYAFRAQKSLALIGGTPDYAPIAGFESPEVPARTYVYSADGRLYAYALPNVVRIFQAEGAQLLSELPLSNVIELSFSPRGTYLSTWERPIKLDDNQQHKNLRVFSVSTGEELVAFTQKSQEGWDLQYTITESHAIRLVAQEIQVFRPTEWGKGVVDKLKVEGATKACLSPGLNPSVAVFVAEKKGAPASIKIYGLLTLSASPTCQKTFFKADRSTIKWNLLGTQVLLLTQTDVDNTNKSYYGETGLYLLSAAGNFDCRVTLDKEGPIHDFAWSPNSKEFGVVYGYMPAKTVIFDQRVRTLYDFGAAPHNYISFNPQARLLALAGFGNLAGKIDIFDRRTLNKLCTIDAPNTSYCDWSPDGRFLLTATLSPRLRVDNGIKIWHCTGALMHVQLVEEMYQASWRPTPVDNVPPFPSQGGPLQSSLVPPPPSPSVSLYQLSLKNSGAGGSTTSLDGTPTKPAGAYRPPGARGNATPAIFKREDEGGFSRTPSGQNTPVRGYSKSPAPPGSAGMNGPGGPGGQGRGGRYVPGAPPPTNQNQNPSRPGALPRGDSGGQGQGQGQGPGKGDGQARKRNKGGKNKGGEGEGGGREGSVGRGQQGKNGANGQQRASGNGIQQNANTNGNSKKPTSIDLNGVNGKITTSTSTNEANGDGNVAKAALASAALTPLDTALSTPVTPGLDSALDPIAKKVRNLNKKLKAIEELKDKAKRGERLEATQMKKIDGEAEIRRELAGLGITD